MNARRLLATSALIFALPLAACGGDNDPSGAAPTTSPPEPADTRPTTGPEAKFPAAFAKKVNPICRETATGVDDLSPIKDTATVRKAAGVYEQGAEKLDALKPPQKNMEVYTNFVDIYRDGATRLNGIADEVERGDSSALQRVTSIIDSVNADGATAAEDFGFTECVT